MKKEIVKTTIRVPRDLWAKVRGKAIEEARSTQDVICVLLRAWVAGKVDLEQNPKRKPKRAKDDR